jgi:hypothetical protein
LACTKHLTRLRPSNPILTFRRESKKHTQLAPPESLQVTAYSRATEEVLI